MKIALPTLKRVLSAFLLILALEFGSHFSQADEFDTLRLRWRDSLTLGTNANALNPNHSNWIASASSSAQKYWNSLNTSPARTWLWSDLNHLATDSSDISGSYARLRSMALGYSIRTSPLETNAGLLLAITNALDWLYTNYYNEVRVQYDRFFDWEISAPQNLNDATVLLYDRLTPSQVANYMAAIEHFAPVPNLTAANKVWKASVVALRGAIVKDSAKIASAAQALVDSFQYTTSGDGFYPDGSFIFHVYYPYNAGYGSQMIETYSMLLPWLKGSSWEITDPAQTNLFNWVYNACQPLIYKGALMQMASGRYYTRTGDDHSDAHDLIAAILQLCQIAPTNDASALRSMAKSWLQSDTYRNFVATQFPPYNLLAQTLLTNISIQPRPELIRHYQFPQMDRAVHLRPGWAFALSMSSSRIGNYESTQGENFRGWYTADGMTYVYNGDLSHYADGFWPTVNPYRLPGTTVNSQPRANGSGSGYLSPTNWTGGASLQDLYGVSGMQLNAWNSSLAAKKSWFMFDNEVVCLGAAITSTNEGPIETTIENRRLGIYGDNAFTVNGVVQNEPLSWSATLTNVSWAHLAGNTPASDIGLYFPQPTNFNVLRESRSGALSDLNANGSTNRLTRNFMTLWFDHGIAPSNGAYAYVLLPNASASQVAGYSANPDIQLLGNSSTAQGVKENGLGITAVNFWKDGTNRLGGITVDKKSSVIVRNDGAYLEFGLSDPTQVNPGLINLEISTPATSLLSADPMVSIQQLTPTIKAAINVNGAAGQTFRARFFVGAMVTLTNSPIADSYVQNGDQTNSNFGGLTKLEVKAAATSQGRETFLRFDLSQVAGNILSANLRLLPFTVNDPLFHAVAYVPDNSWTENSLTWTNKPASSNEFTRWQLGAANTPVLVPITALAQQAAAGDGKLSLRIYSTGTPAPTNGGYTAYASREHGTTNNRPQLLVTMLRIPPTISLQNLSADSVLDAPAAVSLSAIASDLDGGITNVVFFRNASKVGQLTSGPYNLNLSGLGAGQHTFTAVAFDSSGLTATSAPVVITVYNPEPAGRGTGLIAEFFNTKNLIGLQVTRTDPVVNTNWGTGSPDGAIPAENFSARWSGKLQARHAGLHQFHVVSDEGVRLWLGGLLLIDNWNPHGLTEDTSAVSLVPGEYYDIQLEYYEGSGTAAVQLLWTEPSGFKQVIPQSQLYPSDSGLRGAYYASTNLTKLAFSRVDDVVDFYWGNSTPDAALLPPGFSVQWKGKVRANATGLYTFYTLSDDAIRLAINNQTIISNWVPHSVIENSGTISLTAGQFYNLTMDFFDANGNATAVLMWQPPGEAKQLVPVTNLTPHQNNNPPLLNALPNVALNPGRSLSFTAGATDPDLPYQTLTFSLDPDPPAGVSIHPITGAFNWSPPSNQAPGNYEITVRVTDNGNPVMSDAQTFVITISSNLTTTYLTLSPTGSLWRCLDTGVEPSSNWRNLVFNDTAWKTAPAILGYGTGAETTPVSYGPNAANKFPTTYFRRLLYIPDATRVLSLDARLLRNDGVAVYLNGSEIWRDNLPAGAISNGTYATSHVLGAASSNYLTKALNPALLIDGTNVLAVEVHQFAPNGADLAFDLDLKGFATIPTQTPLQVNRAGNSIALSWPADATWLQLVASTNLIPPVLWFRPTNQPVWSNGQWFLQLPVDPNSNQFFRLQSQ